MADVQVNQTSDGDGRGGAWIAVVLIGVVLVAVILWLVLADRGAAREETKIDVDVPQSSTIEVPKVEVPEINVPDKIEVDVPDKVEVDVKTDTQSRTSTR